LSESAVLSDEADPQSLDRRIADELVDLSWRPFKISTIFGALIPIVFVVGIRAGGPVDHVWPWFAAMATVYALRGTLVIVGNRARPTGTDQRRWRAYLFVGALLAPAMWGLAGPLFLHQFDPLRQTFLMTMIVGFAGGVVGGLVTNKMSVMTALPLTLLPLAASSVALGDAIHLILGGMMVIYCFYLMRMGLDHHRILCDALRLRFERSELIERLRKARDAAERANEAKSSFLANMSHELRTPLNAILGFSEMITIGIHGTDATERHLEYAEHIHDSGAHLLDLINDLLDLSKAEAGALELHEEDVDLGRLVATCLDLLAPAAAKAGVSINAAAATNAAIRVRADDRKLRQILLNLLSNAVKFTPRGGNVTVSTSVSEEGVAIAVADTGPGMTPEQVERAMQPFVQIEQGYDKSRQGTGLGLPLIKVLTELHGGTFEMTSTPGQGTTGVVRLPASRITTPLPRLAAQ